MSAGWNEAGSGKVYALRGAITVDENTQQAIDEAVLEMLKTLMEENELAAGQIISAFFTLTADLNASFPATAARRLPGWETVPMLDAVEVEVPGSLSMCIRVMIHCRLYAEGKGIKHVYLRRARSLRPDLG